MIGEEQVKNILDSSVKWEIIGAGKLGELAMHENIMEFVLVPLGVGVLLTYHFWLLYNIIRNPRRTVIGLNAESRHKWVFCLMADFSVQSLHNRLENSTEIKKSTAKVDQSRKRCPVEKKLTSRESVDQSNRLSKSNQSNRLSKSNQFNRLSKSNQFNRMSKSNQSNRLSKSNQFNRMIKQPVQPLKLSNQFNRSNFATSSTAQTLRPVQPHKFNLDSRFPVRPLNQSAY